MSKYGLGRSDGNIGDADDSTRFEDVVGLQNVVMEDGVVCLQGDHELVFLPFRTGEQLRVSLLLWREQESQRGE